MNIADDILEFAPGSKPAAHTRVTARESIFLNASVHFEGEMSMHHVRVRNISAGGIMIDSAVQRTIGSNVVVKIKNIGDVEGRVAWFTSGKMGINFKRSIDPQRARQKLPVAPSPKAPRALFPQ
jgi:PilZ domain